MINKKKYLRYLLFLLIFSVTGVAFAYGVKKLQTPPAEAKKADQKSAKKKKKSEKKPPEVEAVIETLPAVVADNVTEPVAPIIKESQGDQNASAKTTPPAVSSRYPIHKNITTTFFWAGEEAGKDNKNISNLPSAWDEQWVKHFGGVDDPDKRSGFFPVKFVPKENPFYFALPYNDFDNNGNRKKEVFSLIPWAGQKKWTDNESVCKNRWIKIMKGGKAAYAQWQDVGPFKEDDHGYVFGTAAPKSKTNNNAGLDISPAVKDYLGLSDIDKTDWQFVDPADVPGGPWKKIVTTSLCYWK
jgi:hypothetical protein